MAENQTQGKPTTPQDPNSLYISVRRSNRHYMYQIKKRLNEQETLQLHGLGDAMTIVIQVSESLMRLGYVQIQRIETQTIDVQTFDKRIAKKAKLIVTLKKTQDFNNLYQDYEQKNKFEDLLAPKQP